MKWLKSLFSKKKTRDNVRKMPSPKDIATQRGEPWIDVISVDINPSDPGQGSFALDWNEKFVANLIRAGYQMKPDDTDAEIVDRWFVQVCRNVVLETYEQEQAMNMGRHIYSRDIGDGRSEIS